MITYEKALDCYTNSPYKHARKCLENGIEIVDTDVRVLRVKAVLCTCPFVIKHFTSKCSALIGCFIPGVYFQRV